MLDGITKNGDSFILSPEAKNTLAQANRRLTNMSKRQASDKNVRNTLAMAKSDLNITSHNQSNKYQITGNMTQRQAEAMLRSAQTLINSPYSSAKETEALYCRQRKTLGKELGLNARQTKQLVDMFDEDENPLTAQAWQKIKDEPKYLGLSLSVKSSIGEQVQNIGPKKFGLMMRLYTEAGLQDSYGEAGFINFLNDEEVQSFFADNTLSTVEDFVNDKMWM